MSTVLKVNKLCKTYANEGVQNHVLSNVDLTIEEGEFVVIMGASGSGKSTLLYCLSGMTRATSGEVIYDGKDVCSMNEKELTKLRCGGFGFVFQQMNLVPNLTLRENVAVPGYLNKNKTRKEVDLRADELLNTVGILEVKDHNPARTSGGQQQRCAIARGLINEPKILFADEPTGALDYNTGKQILKLLQDTCRETGMTVIVITHNSAITPMADRVIQMRSGRVVSMTVNENPVPIERIEW